VPDNIKYNPECCGQAPKKQEKKMFTTDMDSYDMNETERQRQFLIQQLYNSFYTMEHELRVQFNLIETMPPKDPKEFVEFIKTGKFKFTKNFLNDDGSFRDAANIPHFYNTYNGNYTSFIEWIDPDKVPDPVGLKVADKALEEAKKKAKRLISVGTPTEGLKALEEFEALTF